MYSSTFVDNPKQDKLPILFIKHRTAFCNSLTSPEESGLADEANQYSNTETVPNGDN